MISQHCNRLLHGFSRCTLALGLTVAASSCSHAPQPTSANEHDLSRHIAAVVPTAQPSALPKNWMHGGMMEIFVRAYADSNGDGIGDLRGLISKLPYLQTLGIKGLWLMPIHPSEDGDHGYSVSDYRAIAPEFGSMADFDDLITQAHARGIGIILDYVINHSASTHPLFRQSAASEGNPWRNWYVWSKVAPSGWQIFGRNPWSTISTGAYFGQFDRSMPDWNFREPAVMRFHQDNLRFWLNRGVDGFRFDAVAHLFENGKDRTYDQPENLDLVRTLRETVETYPNRYVVVEAVSRSEVYGSAQYAGSAFTIGLNSTMVNTVKGDTEALRKLATELRTLSPRAATFLANHDEFAGKRLWNQLDGDVARYKLAATLLLTLPGVPFLYYGEEVGMDAAPGLSGDPSLRVPMSWTDDGLNAGFSRPGVKPFRTLAANVSFRNVANQQADPNSLWAHYRSLLALRHSRASLRVGTIEGIDAVGKVLVFERTHGTERTLVLLNFGNTNALVALPKVSSATHRTLLGSAGVIDSNGIQISPLSAAAIDVKR